LLIFRIFFNFPTISQFPDIFQVGHQNGNVDQFLLLGTFSVLTALIIIIIAIIVAIMVWKVKNKVERQT
jgi:hypothetical protein